MKNKNAVELGKLSVIARKKKHGKNFNNSMRKLSLLAKKDRKLDKMTINIPN